MRDKPNATTSSGPDELIDVLNDIEEFLEDHQDVRDGSYGEPQPNMAMQLLSALAHARTEWARADYYRRTQSETRPPDPHSCCAQPRPCGADNCTHPQLARSAERPITEREIEDNYRILANGVNKLFDSDRQALLRDLRELRDAALRSLQSSERLTDEQILTAYREEYFAKVGGELKHRHSDQAIIATVRRLVPSANESTDPDACRVCGLFKRAPDVQGDACPGHKEG